MSIISDAPVRQPLLDQILGTVTDSAGIATVRPAGLDLSAGFLDRFADAELAAPTLENLRKLVPGPTLLQTTESRATPKYLALLGRVLAALDCGSHYAGYTPDQAAVIDDITRRFGGDGVTHPDVLAVARKYRLPPLVLTGQSNYRPLDHDYDNPDHPEHAAIMRLFANQRIKPNSSITVRAALESTAEYRLGDRERSMQWYGHHTGRQVYARALWYDDIPWDTCPGDKRKRARHVAAADRLMDRLLAYAAARSGMPLAELRMPSCMWAGFQPGFSASQLARMRAASELHHELMTAKSYLTGVIRLGQVPEGTETEILVADVVTRAQRAIADRLPAELTAPAPRPAQDDDQGDAAPVGTVSSVIITDAQAEAEERARARESVLGSIRAKLERTPSATDKELRQCGRSQFRKLVDMGELIAEARGR